MWLLRVSVDQLRVQYLGKVDSFWEFKFLRYNEIQGLIWRGKKRKKKTISNCQYNTLYRHLLSRRLYFLCLFFIFISCMLSVFLSTHFLCLSVIEPSSIRSGHMSVVIRPYFFNNPHTLVKRSPFLYSQCED